MELRRYDLVEVHGLTARVEARDVGESDVRARICVIRVVLIL